MRWLAVLQFLYLTFLNPIRKRGPGGPDETETKLKSMKKSFLYLIMLGGFALAACEGDRGPQGPAGPQGPQGPAGGGDGAVNEVFEVIVDFTAANDYFEAFTLDPELGEADMLLVYLLWEMDGNTDIWRPLPQTLFLPEGILKYNFDFTLFDFGLFLEGDFNLANLGPEWTDDQVFRIVVVPGQFLMEHPDLGTADYETVMEVLGKTEADVARIDKRPTHLLQR